MAVVVFVTIERERALRSRAKKRAVFRCAGDVFRRAVTADVAVQADNAIGRRHDDVQFVADHQDGAAKCASHLFDAAIKGRGTGLVEPLGRFVQNQQIGAVEERAREQNALELAAGKVGHLCVLKVNCLCLFKRRSGCVRADCGSAG